MTNNKNILIIEDSADMQSLLNLILKSKGYQTNCSSNGKEALSFLSSTDNLPDLILLDLRMPVMDGFDFLASKNSDPKIKDIPTVLMTGEEATELDGVKSCSAVLTKPLNVQQLVQTVEEFSHLH